MEPPEGQTQGRLNKRSPEAGRFTPAPNPQGAEYVQPHVLGHHLPTPEKTPAWPFHTVGTWMVDIDKNIEAWRQGMKVWRHEHLIRMGYNDAEYRREDLLWSQSNFIHTQMMVEDRYFYDPVAGKYTIDRYLDDLIARYGGIDSVLLWYIYPNIGIDDRNQIDLASDLPGGIEGLKTVVADFHRRGVRVFLPTMPWDNGTRDVGMQDWEAITKLAAEVKADGINGDTYYAVPHAYREASDATGHPVVLQPETTPIADDHIMWNNQSWGKLTRTQVPGVAKLKWIEPRHMVNVENRWGRDRTDDLQYIFFNGIGYVAWENVWGIWNQLTPRAGETLRRISKIERKFSPLMVSQDWEPYAATLQFSVFATAFPSDKMTLWTVINRNEYEVAGDQLAVPHRAGRRYYDIWNGVELSPRLENDEAILNMPLESKGFGCILALEDGAAVDKFEEFLGEMKALAKVPLQSLSNVWKAIPQQIVPIEATKAVAAPPAGMVRIPAGQFDFRVNGIEIEGYTWDGVDFQYPWETSARRNHLHRMAMKPFHMDRNLVTNADYLEFVEGSGYYPLDDHNYLRDWQDGMPRPGWENKPVTWIGIEDARVYAAWAGKRLPHEWEWQYAAQGIDGRLFPWGNDWNADAVPAIDRGRNMQPPSDVGAHPAGASPFGVLDLVGNVWQWTDEFMDDHTRAAALRGGCSYNPTTSHWYFPQAYQLDQHGKYLLMAPSKDRSGKLGFRCVVDATDG
ncbi:MAG: sulfatase-modifying factor protein [Alphaproteobacteria bacterium]|nr:MAG: sulfatase-modifying factor protein [Alphaproteobacteria bacterium]